MRRHPLHALLLALALAPTGCEGDMIRDAGGGQDDSSSPGQPADDGGLDGRTPLDGALDGAADGGGDGALDGGADGGDGALDGAADGQGS